MRMSITRRQIALLQFFWMFQACSCFQMTPFHLTLFCSSHSYPITRYRRRRQERSVLVDHRMSFGLKDTESSSSSSSLGEKTDMDNDDARNEEKQEEASFDQNTHLRILNDNLKRFSGKSLLQHMKDAEEAADNMDTNTGDDAALGNSMRTIGGMMETQILEQDYKNDDSDDASNAAVDDDDDDSWQPDDVHMSMRFALISHGAVNGMDGPVHNYANFAALSAFSYTRQQILRIPACRMAEPGSDQADLSQLYMSLRQQQQRPTSNNILQNHQAFHCTQYLQRFLIRNAIVWNCFDDDGEYYGQALFFDRQKVTFLDDAV